MRMCLNVDDETRKELGALKIPVTGRIRRFEEPNRATAQSYPCT